MKNICPHSACLLLLVLILLPAVSPAQEIEKNSLRKSASITTNDRRAAFLINNLFNYYQNNGSGSYNPITGNGALEFPRRTPGPDLGTVIYEEGLIWGGYHMGRPAPKAGGSQYRQGLQAGRILIPGTPRPTGIYRPNCVADDPALLKYRVYRVRPDVRPGTSFNVVEKALNEEAILIARYEPGATAASLYSQYIQDWNEWPARGSATDSLGLAPFTDLDGNGSFDPSIDTPGVPSADQTLYYVSNDCDTSRVYNFTGSPSLGIEMHRTIWGYAGRGILDNVIFNSTLLINKSGVQVDSMFVGHWMDPDIGGSSDDLIGCDTLLGMTYAYNGNAYDIVFGYRVPAVGSILLGGPCVPGGGFDSAIVRLRYRQGVRNLPATSAIYQGHSSVIYGDPPIGVGADLQFFRLLKGISGAGQPFIDSTTMMVTCFPFVGDPVRQTGHYMRSSSSSDWRNLISSGPFRFAAGDTQEVVVATIVAQGADRLASVASLKRGAEEVRRLYGDLLAGPVATATVAYPAPSTASVSVVVDGRKTPLWSGGKVILRRQNGTQVKEFPIAVDGVHDGLSPGDQIFQGSGDVATELAPLSADVEGRDFGGGALRYPRILPSITVAGPVSVTGPEIYSDNLNGNGRGDQYENIRYGLTLTNGTLFSLRALRFHAQGDQVKQISSLNAGAEFALQYDPALPSSVFATDLLSVSGSTAIIPVSISDSVGNSWSELLQFPVVPTRYRPVEYRAKHISGQAYGDLDVLLIDRHLLKDRTYLIRAFDPDSAGRPPAISVEDSIDGRVLLGKRPLPDPLGHEIEAVEGFKILRGSVESPGSRGAYVNTMSGTNPWTSSGGAGGLMLEGLNGTIGSGVRSWPSGGVPYDRLRDVEIQFTEADSNWRVTNPIEANVSYAHRYLAGADLLPAQPSFTPFITNGGPGYPYQDYVKNFPFAAFDVSVSPARRLMVGYLENNVTAGLVDGRYCPPIGAIGTPPSNNNADSLGPREWFFIFDLPYGETPAPSLQVDLLHARTPIMWFGTPARYSDRPPSLSRRVRINTPNLPATGDVWSFNPVALLGGIEQTIPDQVFLFPNYPNPFNAGTSIRYGLPADSRVSLRIYNVLGQEVRTLFDELQLEGYRTVRWDGRNNAGMSVATGVYFYRLQGLTTEAVPREFATVRKLVVVR